MNNDASKPAQSRYYFYAIRGACRALGIKPADFVLEACAQDVKDEATLWLGIEAMGAAAEHGRLYALGQRLHGRCPGCGQPAAEGKVTCNGINRNCLRIQLRSDQRAA